MATPAWSWLLWGLLLTTTSILQPASAVKHENFKTCDQSGFCKRNRAIADEASTLGSSWQSPYTLDSASLSFADGTLTGTVRKIVDTNGMFQGETRALPLTISFLESGSVRVTMDEEVRQKGDFEMRHGSPARKERYNEAEKWVVMGGLERSHGAVLKNDADAGTTRVTYGKNGNLEAVIRHIPFGMEFKRDGETQIKLNDRGLMNMEHWRPKVDRPAVEQKEGEDKPAPPSGPDESTWWEESFGGNTDSKPRGPESVAMDVTFPGYEHVFGIPEHSGPMSLRETRGGGDDKFEDPYRLYNSDVFEYLIDSPMTLYGAIPFMQAHKKDSTVGVFWLNAAETWVDIIKSKTSTNPLSLGTSSKTTTHTHWFSENGLLDIFVMLGPTPQSMSKAYGELTGYTQLPQLFAIAYHQCRWNYVTDEDVKDVDRKFDKHNIPYDVIWLDIEYLEEKKYFTWDPLTFPEPVGMGEQLDEHDRKLVIIIDPHIKRTENYPVLDQLTQKDLAVKTKEADKPWEGWCWPGSSYWVDCFNPKAIEWWTSLFRYDVFKGTLPNTFIWNDMNEPSVFNGPETTMPKDNIHHGNWEHRDVHNVNGLTFMNATFQALEIRDDPKGKTPTKRPFILTRSFYAGSQRLGAMWTGDNQAEWSHLKGSLPMVLQMGISGYPFAGADVAGFFGNPGKELLVRWYQAGAFYPFFRAHAHIDTRRREPYLAGSPYKEIITQALRLRYSLLPSWYTAFHSASVNGTPIVQPMWYMHPNDAAGFALDDQLYLGGTGLLTKPVTTEGATSVSIYLPAEDVVTPYYSYHDFQTYTGGGKMHTIDAPLSTLPLLMRAGHIFTRRDRPRRSSGLMRHDPFTLVVVLDPAHPAAVGELYYDDGESYAYREGAAIHRRFVFEAKDGSMTLTSQDVGSSGAQTESYLASIAHLTVEKIIVVGAPASWSSKSSVSISGAKTSEAALTFHAAAGKKAAWAVVKAPAVEMGRGWSVEF